MIKHLEPGTSGIKAFLFVLLVSFQWTAEARPDTIRVDVGEFVRLAMQKSALIETRQQSVELSKNRLNQAQAQRFLPRIELSTQHGLVPGVTGQNPDLSPGELYLDPTLRNDWYNWGVFTRAEVSSLQPIYTWGAISNAIKAAEQGVVAAQAEFEAQSSAYELQLYELYYTRLLTLEMQRLIQDAKRTLEKAEEQLQQMLDDGEQDIEEADVFQFQIFKYEFFYRVDEINETVKFVEAAWNLALQNYEPNTVYMPLETFLDPLVYQIRDVSWFETMARNNRPEFKQAEAAFNAASYGLKATKASNYPSLFLGLSAAYANTPNRPKQDNPFIINNTNYESIRYGIGIRQSLNFSVNRTNINRSEIQVRQARYAREAAHDGIMLDLREKYRNMMMSHSRLQNTRNGLQVSAEWLRMEQIDYDLGFGDVKNLIDALRTNLELEVSYRQRIHDFNVNIGKLNKSAGISILPDITN